MQPDEQAVAQLLNKIERLCDAMIEQQRRKVMKVARTLRPNVTDDDILDPTSIPELVGNPVFTYEEGQFHGLVAAKVAILREGAEHLRGMMGEG